MRIIRGLEAAKTALAGEVLADRQVPEEEVRQIVRGVRSRGDAALFDYAAQFDGVKLDSLEVTAAEIAGAGDGAGRGLLEALELAARKIREFHSAQKERLGLEFSHSGLGLVVRPLECVGVYVPGGKASYPSTVLMTAIPARVAGVSEIVMATPPAEDGSVSPAVLAAAGIAGVDRVFKIGGAQAIAAMAYGTRSVPRVDKICGPGNIYVTLAKKQVYGVVGIDGLHGPTETVIVADESADPALCAADLLAQAEHDEAAVALLITTSDTLAAEVSREVESQLAVLERGSIARESLESNGALIVVESIDEAIELADMCAPEHLCLAIRDGRSYINDIHHAGGIFIDTAEALGDYTAGPSHVMPTGRTARFGSPLSVLDFLKISLVFDLDKNALKELGPAAAALARAEGLTAHALSVEKRLEKLGEPGR